MIAARLHGCQIARRGGSRYHDLVGWLLGLMPNANISTVTIYDSLGTDSVQKINVDQLKWRFFELGVRVGIALQMLFMCVLLMIPEKNDAIDELSGLYYPLFRGVFLLSFFGVLFALNLFAWKRTGIDYGSIFGVSPHRTNYHAVVRAASTVLAACTIPCVGDSHGSMALAAASVNGLHQPCPSLRTDATAAASPVREFRECGG